MSSDRELGVYAALGVATILGGAAYLFLIAGQGESPSATKPAIPAASVTPMTPPPPPVAVAPSPPKPPKPPRAAWPATTLGPFDPSRFDTEAFLPIALADARKVWKDATLVSLTAVEVASDGISDLTTGRGYTASYAFRSLTKAEAGTACLHWVYVDEKGAWSETTSDPKEKLCAVPAALLNKPRCTVARAFAILAEKHPPRPGPARVLRWSFARLDNAAFRADWSVSGFPTSSDDTATDLSTGFPDNCTK